MQKHGGFMACIFIFKDRIADFVLIQEFMDQTKSVFWHILPGTYCKRLLLTKDIIAKVIRNGKIVWKHGLYCWIFPWTWNIWGDRPENTLKQQKMVGLWGIAKWKWLWGCFSHFSLLWLWCQLSKAVQKITTDQKDYHKCSSCVIVCWIAIIYRSITVKKGWLLT